MDNTDIKSPYIYRKEDFETQKEFVEKLCESKPIINPFFSPDDIQDG